MNAEFKAVPTRYLDLDGCLIDSRASIAASVDHALRHHGLAPLAAGEIDALIGPPIARGFERLLLARGSAHTLARALVATFRERYATASLTETKLFPGIEHMLDSLGAHARLVVVTSKARFLAVPILEALRILDRFAEVVGPEPDRMGESKIETLARARTRWPKEPGDCMIGDRSHDMEAGCAFGLIAIGVTWGSGTAEELLAAGADYVVDAPAELAPLCAAIAERAD